MKRIFLMLLATISLTGIAADLTARVDHKNYQDLLKIVEEAARADLATGWEVEAGYIIPSNPALDVEPSPYLIVKDAKGKLLGEVQPSNRIHQILSAALVTALNNHLSKEYPGNPVQLSVYQYGAYKVEIASLNRRSESATLKFKFPADAKKPPEAK
jgi:hypothetical protein